ASRCLCYGRWIQNTGDLARVYLVMTDRNGLIRLSPKYAVWAEVGVYKGVFLRSFSIPAPPSDTISSTIGSSISRNTTRSRTTRSISPLLPDGCTGSITATTHAPRAELPACDAMVFRRTQRTDHPRALHQRHSEPSRRASRRDLHRRQPQDEHV